MKIFFGVLIKKKYISKKNIFYKLKYLFILNTKTLAKIFKKVLELLTPIFFFVVVFFC